MHLVNKWQERKAVQDRDPLLPSSFQSSDSSQTSLLLVKSPHDLTPPPFREGWREPREAAWPCVRKLAHSPVWPKLVSYSLCN